MQKMIGFGTYPYQGKVCEEAVTSAIEAGYTMFDTATFYDNFEAIAAALKGRKREDFYLISKVWHDSQASEELRRDLEKTLKAFQTDYLDGYLIHWPNSQIPIKQTLSAMDKLRQERKIRDIGLCNVTVNHLRKVVAVGIPIRWVQIEMHPHFFDRELLEFCKEKVIQVQAWRPLNKGRLKDDSMLMAIGKKYEKSASQVALRWIIQHGCIPLPGSKNREHIRENIDIFDFALLPDEMKMIDVRAEKGERYRMTEERGLGFTDEFDYTFEQCWAKV